MTTEQAIDTVAKELKLQKCVARAAYNSMYKFIMEKATALPLDRDLTDEEFNELRTSFNVPSLGKFGVTLQRYKNTKLMLKHIKQNVNDLQNIQTEATVQSDSSD